MPAGAWRCPSACYDPFVRPTRRRVFAWPVALGLAGCAGPGLSPAAAPPTVALHAPDLTAAVDPTVRGARLLPADLTQARTWGEAPGGGTRAIVAGVRFVDGPDGALVAAEDRLPSGVGAVTFVPERMGGGFLYVVGTHLWRSDTWLGPVRPLFTAPSLIGNVHVGLDRVYVRTQAGAVGAVDPRTGALVDMGPLPASPGFGRMAALDAWRAVTVTDLRGAQLTLDAGSTWRPLPLPIEPTEVVTLADAIAIGGMDESRHVEWWEVRAEGQVGRLPAAPSAMVAPTPSSSALGSRSPGTPDSVARTFGDRPLVAALEDGWPLRDGTALVARDGVLGRVRLSDGVLVETAADAFPLRPARCHPVSVSRAAEPGAFAFVCGEPRGRTVLYLWDAAGARLSELRRFDLPREVLASGNGGLAVRGPCAADAPADRTSPEIAWCIRPPGAPWREIHFRGDDVDQARMVVLADGRVALVRAPVAGDLSTGRLTVTDGVRAEHLPLRMPEVKSDVALALLRGVWMDGFEERRPGVLGGWVDDGGDLLGVELELDGHVRVGEHLKDAGSPFVSGRWGFGWTASRSGFETIDGGMTWHKGLDMPDVIAIPRSIGERACGPVGCLLAGWMRVGWGAPEATEPPKEPSPPPRPISRDMPPLELSCQPAAGPVPVSPRSSPRSSPPRVQVGGLRPGLPGRVWMGGGLASVSCAPELGFFQGRAPPAIAADECGVQVDGFASLERPVYPMGLTKAYAWGPRSGDWDSGGKWKVAWLWPWGGWPDARASATVPAPWSSRDAAARFLGVSSINALSSTLWTVMPSDDPDHALLLGRRAPGTRSFDVFALESDRAPVEEHRPAGEPFGEVQGATRVAGRWYLATAQSGAEQAATVLWALDGGTAREIARLPRSGGETPSATRLSHRTDGGAIGLVVEGQSRLDGGKPPRWVVAVDLESGTVSEPEPLAPADLANPATAFCTGDDSGWVIDLAYSGGIHVNVGSWTVSLQSPVARLRLSRSGACLERVTGSRGADAHAAEMLTRPSPPPAHMDARLVDASVYAASTRYALRCALAK